MRSSRIRNILSIDLEDWHHLVHRKITRTELITPPRYVFRQVDRLLELFEGHGTTATFFVMGALAEHYPELIRKVADAGHEVACHGHEHLLVDRLAPPAFRADTRRCKRLLEDVTGQAVVGYRAAEFSVRRSTLWALTVLAELGFAYDSSIFPVHHRRYGIPGFPREIAKYSLACGRELVEIPPSVIIVNRIPLPVAGGGYFRYIPHSALRRIVGRLNAERLPMVTYFHPYEFDPHRLNILDFFTPDNTVEWIRAIRFNIHQNIGRSSVYRKLDRLLYEFDFCSCKEYLGQVAINERHDLSC